MTTTIAVLGATSYTGLQLIEMAASEFPNVQFHIAGRSLSKLEMLADFGNVVSTHAWQIGDPIGPIVAGAHSCIDLSYSIQGLPSRVVGSARTHSKDLIAASAAAALSRVVVTSSVAVYGEPAIRYDWREVPPPSALKRPRSVYARLKQVSEQAAVAEARNRRVSLSIMRVGHILGPGSRMASNLASRLLKGTPVMLAGQSAPSNATTVQGLTRSMLVEATSERGRSLVVGNHVDLDQWTYDQIVTSLAEAMGMQPLVIAQGGGPLGLRDRAVRWVSDNRGALGLAQSYAGALEAVSRPAFSRLKRETKALQVGGGIPAAAFPVDEGLVSLYWSDAIPHSSSAFGSSVQDWRNAKEFRDLKLWLGVSGFSALEDAKGGSSDGEGL